MNNWKIIIKNKALDEKTYRVAKPKLLKLLKSMSFGIDIETVVKVVIVDRIPTDPKADPKDDAGASMRPYQNSFLIEVNAEAVRNLANNDYGIQMELYHEFAHIYDLVETARIGGYDNRNDAKTKKEQLTKLGFEYWTEFFAYNLTFRDLKISFAPSEYELYLRYCKIDTLNDKYIDTGNKKYIKLLSYAIFQFVYHSAEFLAGYTMGKAKESKLSRSITKRKEFEQFAKFLSTMSKYSVKTANKNHKNIRHLLYKMGKYIYKKLYKKYRFVLASVWKHTFLIVLIANYGSDYFINFVCKFILVNWDFA